MPLGQKLCQRRHGNYSYTFVLRLCSLFHGLYSQLWRAVWFYSFFVFVCFRSIATNLSFVMFFTDEAFTSILALNSVPFNLRLTADQEQVN